MTSRFGLRAMRKKIRCISVQRDLDAITHIEDDREVPPSEGGLEQAVVDAIGENTHKMYRSGAHPLISI